MYNCIIGNLVTKHAILLRKIFRFSDYFFCRTSCFLGVFREEAPEINDDQIFQNFAEFHKAVYRRFFI